MKIATLNISLALGIIVSAFAQPTSSPPKAAALAAEKPAFVPAAEDPKLPRVLLIGDSISMGYTGPVRDLLKGKANVHRNEGNARSTANGLAHLKQWLGVGKWDVIHFNWGLHDLRIMDDGKQQVSPEAYDKNLRELVRQLKATGARLIWATTTPVPEGAAARKSADVPTYNAIARKIMEENKIAVDDLYNFTLPRLAEIQLPANVHFTPQGSATLAKPVAASIESALDGKK